MTLTVRARWFAGLLLVLAAVATTLACSGGSESSPGEASSSPAATEAVATASATLAPSATPEPTATPEPPTEVPATTAPAPPAITQPTARPAGPAGIAAAIRGYGFPYEMRVAAGSTVVWTNFDNVAHDVTASDGSWASPVMGQGDTFAHTFAAPGRYGYVCKLHPYMTAVLIVQ